MKTTVEEALGLIGIDSSQVIRSTSVDCKDYILFGSYKGEQIDVMDNGIDFIVCLGLGRKNYKIHKLTKKIEEFQIFVA